MAESHQVQGFKKRPDQLVGDNDKQDARQRPIVISNMSFECPRTLAGRVELRRHGPEHGPDGVSADRRDGFCRGFWGFWAGGGRAGRSFGLASAGGAEASPKSPPSLPLTWGASYALQGRREADKLSAPPHGAATRYPILPPASKVEAPRMRVG